MIKLFEKLLNCNKSQINKKRSSYNIIINALKDLKGINIINSVIKESALACIPHTRVDPELNEKCIRFSDKLSGEIAYFPGINSEVLDNIDIIQLKAKYLYYIKPNIYVISALNDVASSLKYIMI